MPTIITLWVGTSLYNLVFINLINSKILTIQLIFTEVDIERLKNSPSLADVDLRENPVPPATVAALKNLTTIRVRLTVREPEEWEDLNI